MHEGTGEPHDEPEERDGIYIDEQGTVWKCMTDAEWEATYTSKPHLTDNKNGTYGLRFSLRHAVERTLYENETLSSFIEQALIEQVKRRQLQDEFISRGLASRDKAKQTSEYYDANDVLDTLNSLLISAKNK